MKKAVIVIVVLFFSIFIYSCFKLEKTKYDNKKLETYILNLKRNNKILNKRNQEYQNEINKTKDEKKNSWEELEIWQENEEKLKKALSS